MLKIIKSIHDELKPLPLILVVLALGTWFYMLYTEREIHCKYTGIKFQAGMPEVVEAISIEIDGKYTLSLLGTKDQFVGTIKIGDRIFSYLTCPLALGPSRMNDLDTDLSGHYGMIFAGRLFSKVTIEMHAFLGNGTYQSNGWHISAPCTNRNEAVEIANFLKGRIFKGYKVE